MMLSAGVGTIMHSSPQKSRAIIVSSLPTTSEASLASSVTPAKAICAAEQQQTPQSVNNNASDERNTLASTGDALGYSTTKTQKSTTKKRFRPSPDKKVAKNCSLLKKLKMAMVTVMMMQMPLIRSAQSRMHEQ